MSPKAKKKPVSPATRWRRAFYEACQVRIDAVKQMIEAQDRVRELESLLREGLPRSRATRHLSPPSLGPERSRGASPEGLAKDPRKAERGGGWARRARPTAFGAGNHAGVIRRTSRTTGTGALMPWLPQT